MEVREWAKGRLLAKQYETFLKRLPLFEDLYPEDIVDATLEALSKRGGP
jgi:hypothetical protein